MEAGVPRGKRPAPAVNGGHVVGEKNVGARVDRRQQQFEADEEKVEEFYELMRNIQQMRGTWKGQQQYGSGSNKKKPRVDGAGGANSVPPWKPVFRLQDFVSGAQEDRGRTDEMVDKVCSSKVQDEKRTLKVNQGASEDGKQEVEDEMMMVVEPRCRAGSANRAGVRKETGTEMAITTGSTPSAAMTENLDLRLTL